MKNCLLLGLTLSILSAHSVASDYQFFPILKSTIEKEKISGFIDCLQDAYDNSSSNVLLPSVPLYFSERENGNIVRLSTRQMGSGYLLVRTEVNKTTGAVVMQESEVAVFVSTSSDKDFFKSCASAAQANIESFEMPKPKDDPSKRRNGGG